MDINVCDKCGCNLPLINGWDVEGNYIAKYGSCVECNMNKPIETKDLYTPAKTIQDVKSPIIAVARKTTCSIRDGMLFDISTIALLENGWMVQELSVVAPDGTITVSNKWHPLCLSDYSVWEFIDRYEELGYQRVNLDIITTDQIFGVV